MTMGRELPRDVHVRVLAVVMGVVSAPLVLMLLLSPLALARVLLFASDYRGDDMVAAIVVIPLAFLLGVYGAVMAVVARGLWKGRARSGLPRF